MTKRKDHPLDEEIDIGCQNTHAARWCCSRCSGCEKSGGEISLTFGDLGAEKLSAELEQHAAMEAESLVTANGLICNERLALLSLTFHRQFVQRVLSRVPFASLLTLPREDWDGNALNTSLLLEDFREMRHWLESSPEAKTVYPVRLVSIFDPQISLGEELKVFKNLADQSFRATHPNIEGSRVRTAEAAVALNLLEFRSLFRSFTHGLLENVQFHPEKVVCSGGAMSWCVRCLTPAQKLLCQEEADATHHEAIVRTLVTRKFGQVASNLIMLAAFGGIGQSSSSGSAGALRYKLREEFGHKEWEGGDIDLFVMQRCAEDTVLKTLSAIERSIIRITGRREAITLRTKNTLTVVGGWPLPNVQVVCKTVRSIQELLVLSDIDCTAMAYDGARVLASQRALRAISTGYNFIPKQLLVKRNSHAIRSIARFSKYLRRGFGLLVFEHCRHVPRCDRDVPRGSLQLARRMRLHKEPPCKVGATPDENGSMLASWMNARLPKNRTSSTSNTLAGTEVATELSDSASDRSGDDFKTHYAGADVLIPCGKGVCPETIRAYVRHLQRPGLLQEVVSTQITVEPRTTSDRRHWQDRARGKCYMCKVALSTKAEWPICPSCTDFNLLKRKQTADCQGLVAVVTGGRTKIGREVALRLLRSGATVVITSRFPHCALERYSQEEDFPDFKDRLLIQGADFRSLASVQQLVDTVMLQFSHIDVLIHNAAQTIRRPPAYYESLIRREQDLASLADGAEDLAPTDPCQHFIDQTLALLPAKLCMKEDIEADVKKSEWFPPGKTDKHGEQLDLRSFTSWTQKVEDTETPELAEILSINLIVPYLLTARWLPLMREAPFAFIVFVSSQEGSFVAPDGSGKNSTHPHTNVAKAGLNMLAKTIAGDLRKSCIFTSAVDPGWVSWMMPGAGQETQQAPLSEADGAARVLDPVFCGVQALKAGRSPPTGVLFKDFRVTRW